MLLGVVLLYVGVVLVVNGIWLIGQAQAAQARVAAERRKVPVGASVVGHPAIDEEAAAEAAAGDELAGRPVVSVPRAEASPLFIQNREVAVLNVFTGFIGVAVAITLLVQGSAAGDLASVRGAGYILLFAFTYLWVSVNQFLNAGGRAFGWYCLFVAITAIPAGIYTLSNANGNTADIWLGIDWFAWAVLWFLFWVLLTLERPISALAGWVALVEGIGTAWALGFAVLIAKFAF